MFNEEFNNEYETALRDYREAMKVVYDFLGDPRPIIDGKIQFITTEEATLYEIEMEARDRWNEARRKYFNF